MSAQEILGRLGLAEVNSGACGADWLAAPGGGELSSINPATGGVLARVSMASAADDDAVVVVVEVGPGAPERLWKHRAMNYRLVGNLGVAVVHSRHEPVGPRAAGPLDLVGDDATAVDDITHASVRT